MAKMGKNRTAGRGFIPKFDTIPENELMRSAIVIQFNSTGIHTAIFEFYRDFMFM